MNTGPLENVEIPEILNADPTIDDETKLVNSPFTALNNLVAVNIPIINTSPIMCSLDVGLVVPIPRLPETNASPIMCSLDVGLVVPTPRLPELLTISLVAKPVSLILNK